MSADAIRCTWLKNQGVKLKKHLSQLWSASLFDSAIDDLMIEWKQNPQAFMKKWNGS